MLKALSHSAITLWDENRDAFYLRYFTEQERGEQTPAMLAGCAFDELVKAWLDVQLRGGDPAAIRGDTTAIHLMTAYATTGAYRRLKDWIARGYGLEMEQSQTKTIQGVPLVGVPDVSFRNSAGLPVALDFKVRGYCSKGTTSPTKGYALCRDAPGWPSPSRSHNKPHKDYRGSLYRATGDGFNLNETPLEFCREAYASQLSIYAWLAGVEVGGEFIAAIDEIVAKEAEPLPLLRVANHRGFVSSAYQRQLMQKCKTIWQACESGHVFTELTRAENDARCEALKRKGALAGSNAFSAMTKGSRFAG